MRGSLMGGLAMRVVFIRLFFVTHVRPHIVLPNILPNISPFVV